MFSLIQSSSSLLSFSNSMHCKFRVIILLMYYTIALYSCCFWHLKKIRIISVHTEFSKTFHMLHIQYNIVVTQETLCVRVCVCAWVRLKHVCSVYHHTNSGRTEWSVSVLFFLSSDSCESFGLTFIPFILTHTEWVCLYIYYYSLYHCLVCYTVYNHVQPI